MQPVWDDHGEIIASLYYTYYKRTNIKNSSKRPIIMSFNGGPGCAFSISSNKTTRRCPRILRKGME